MAMANKYGVNLAAIDQAAQESARGKQHMEKTKNAMADQKAMKGLRKQMETATEAERPAILNQMATYNPKEANQVFDFYTGMDENKRAYMRRTNDDFIKALHFSKEAVAEGKDGAQAYETYVGMLNPAQQKQIRSKLPQWEPTQANALYLKFSEMAPVMEQYEQSQKLSAEEASKKRVKEHAHGLDKELTTHRGEEARKTKETPSGTKMSRDRKYPGYDSASDFRKVVSSDLSHLRSDEMKRKNRELYDAATGISDTKLIKVLDAMVEGGHAEDHDDALAKWPDNPNPNPSFFRDNPAQGGTEEIVEKKTISFGDLK